ncbi:MAG: energy-coupling factor transporter ATPase [Methanobacterium sp.]|jgi:energy-coupling factor transport system ATP-binding protein
MNIIEVKDLSFKYAASDRFALNNMDFQVKKGEFVGIAGRSGCGKSTLLYSLGGIIPHAVGGEKNGIVKICGLDTEEHDISTLTTRVGMVFQNPEVQLFNVTVEDELAFIAENLNYATEKIKECVDFAMDAVGIRELKDRYPFELSGGEKQKVALASAISVKPEVLVLDEPTSELDARGRRMVLETLEKLNHDGMTIILAEHNLDEAVPLMDQLMILDDGQIRIFEEPKEVFKSHIFDEIKLRAPQSVELGMKLNQRELPLSIDEAVRCMENNLSNLRIKKKNPQISHGKPVIEMENLFFRRDSKEILSNINMVVNKGEVVALVGHNGSGKTTLAMLLMGLLKPTDGNIKVLGKVVMGNTKKLQGKAGFLFQNPEHQLFCDSVKSEITYGIEDHGNNLASRLIKQMDLEKFKDKHPLTLSRGEKQRVATATALSRDPEILIIDEPTTGQDWDHVSAFLNLVENLNQQGKTILIITHDMRVVAEYCPRLVVMKNGKIIMDSDTRTVFSNMELLEQADIRPAPISEISFKAGITPPLLKLAEFTLI